MQAHTIDVIKATVPVLKSHGEALTRLFYQRMFENNPEVKPFFNLINQQAGKQQKALATAICAYAENIDNPSVLAGAVELIAQKHASLGIQAEHYPIVGANLLAAIRELLGDDASDDIIDAWAEAYQFLADILIAREQEIYQQHSTQYGWQGFKAFRVIKHEASSENIRSLYLQPADNTKVAPHLAGQYVTVKIENADGSSQMRQYSLSNTPGSESIRISVKRETAPLEGQPDGLVSSHLHNNIDVGDTLLLAPPCGEFFLQNNNNPVVMIAGGVGITPLLSMTHQLLARTDTNVTLVQAAIDGRNQAFSDELAELDDRYENFNWHVRLSAPSEDDRHAGNFDSEGLIDAQLIATLDNNADYYLCGPLPMMQHCQRLLTEAGVADERIYTETFGPALQ